jgi:proteasome lid subunit RPN8/RPN11
MTFSIRRIIRVCVAPEHELACSHKLWLALMKTLVERGQGRRESGAFLLGRVEGRRRRIEVIVPYDDLDGGCLDTGIVIFDGAGYGPLWTLCRETGLSVVADVHTHGEAPFQSEADRTNPMIARPGHIAIIVPNFACGHVVPGNIGLYRYCGKHRWDDLSFVQAARRLYVGVWG